MNKKITKKEKLAASNLLKERIRILTAALFHEEEYRPTIWEELDQKYEKENINAHEAD